MPLQIKRGTNTQRLAYTPSQGELVYVTDYDSAGVAPVWIGTGDVVTPYAEVGGGSGGLTELSNDTTPELGGNLSLAGYEINGVGDIDITGTITSTGAITSPAFVGDFQGSLYTDNSSVIVDGITGNIRTNNISTIGGGTLNFLNNVRDIGNNITAQFTLAKQNLEVDLSSDNTDRGSINFTRWDTNGETLESFIRGGRNDIYMIVDDGSETYPISNLLIWNSQGRLGLGTSSPSATLDVQGDVVVVGSLTAGSMLLSGTNIDTDDSSAITVTPAVTFNSDVTVENSMIVNNTLTVDTLEVTNFQTVGAGTPELESATDILLTAGTRVTITQSPFKVASFTTIERNALSPENGDIIYNTTDNKFQGYENGAWANLI